VITALRQVTATRYVLPLREGGSLPGLLEADDLGTYVVKFRGAGQGPKSLAAEIIVGELGRALGLPVPELVLVDLDPALAPAEPDQEVQDLLRASAGLNLGMDYLPGSLGFDPTVDDVDPALAAQVVWFDALVLNVDRSWRNPNLLRWHGRMWLIDHGAALYFHHSWPTAADAGQRAYRGATDHVLLGTAGPLEPAHASLAPQVTGDLLAQVLAMVPDAWLTADGFDDASAIRRAYADVLLTRAQQPQSWLPEVEVARAAAV
jgi:hypothetical protein